jgi:hypothetical protein
MSEAANAKPTDGISGRPGGTISNTPIVPEVGSSSGKLLRFLLLVLVAAALVYFFLHYR